MLEFPFKKLHIINYFLIALILFSALLLSRDIISHAFSKKGSGALKAEDGTGNKRMEGIQDIMNYAAILEKNPFGPPLKFQPIATRSFKKNQGSLSELILVGTASGPKNLSYAILLDKSQTAPVRQEIFAYDEDVYGYGKLTRIGNGIIEITQDTNSFIIELEDIKSEQIHTGRYSSSQAQFVRKISEKEYILDQRKIQEALNNPEQILTDARLMPNIEDGKQEGFMITEVRPGGLYASLGLKNGDTLLRINDLELSSPEVAMQAMSALRGMNTINLDIIRGDSRMTMNYQIR